jgi:hypothetical protein
MAETKLSFSEFSLDFHRISQAFFAKADENQRAELFKLLQQNYLSFTREALGITGQGCPSGWKECNGACIPSGDDC